MLEIMYTFLVRGTNKKKMKPQLLTQNHNHVWIELIMVTNRSEELVWWECICICCVARLSTSQQRTCLVFLVFFKLLSVFPTNKTTVCFCLCKLVRCFCIKSGSINRIRINSTFGSCLFKCLFEILANWKRTLVVVSSTCFVICICF